MDARRIALSILNRIFETREVLDPLLDGVVRDYPGLSAKDQALLRALVFGVLRRKSRLDYMIGHFSKTPLRKIEEKVKNVLRIGLFQIVYLDRIPVSAAVNTSVDMAKAYGGSWIAGFVNGVLRNAVDNYQKVIFPDPAEGFIDALSINHSLPAWMIRRWTDRFGKTETERLCESINMEPPVTVRTNTLKISRENLMRYLETGADDVCRTPFAPDGISFKRPGKSVSRLSGFQNGWFQVQDEAAQLVVLLLDAEPGLTVMDACCGFGGKTGYIGQVMKNSGKIFALDRNFRKLEILNSEMNRLGISNVEAICMDGLLSAAALKNRSFDRVLLDAPCSGMGVIRRNPDIRWIQSPKNIKKLSRLQTLLMNSLSHLVVPGGFLVYSVCSTEPEENERVIREFLSSNPDFTLDTNAKLPGGCEMADIVAGGILKSFPHRHAMDGFFAARLRRRYRQKG